MRILAASILVCSLASCATHPTPAELRSMSGVEMYLQLCSSCHGVEGRGDGPVSPHIKVRIPDLTRIAARDGGELPTEDVRRIIDGRTDRRVHGPREMPVWGWQLYDMSSDDGVDERSRTNSMIDRLVEYLRTIQRS